MPIFQICRQIVGGGWDESRLGYPYVPMVLPTVGSYVSLSYGLLTKYHLGRSFCFFFITLKPRVE